MPDKIQAKFKVDSVVEQGNEAEKYGEQVSMTPVYSADPESENYSFSEATPAGNIDMYISNPGAFGFFMEGQEYLIEFIPATSA